MSELPSHLRDRILQATLAAPAPNRAQASTRRTLAIALGMLGSVGIWLTTGGLVPGARTGVYLAVTLLPMAAVLLFALYQTASQGKASEGPTSAASAIPGALVLIALPVGILLAHAFGLDDSFASGPRHDLQCALLGTAFGLPAALGFLAARRHQLALRGAPLALLIGAAAFGMGALYMVLRCTCVDLTHLTLAHAAPPVVMTAVLVTVVRALGLRLAR
jgi:hypothetical protein